MTYKYELQSCNPKFRFAKLPLVRAFPGEESPAGSSAAVTRRGLERAHRIQEITKEALQRGTVKVLPRISFRLSRVACIISSSRFRPLGFFPVWLRLAPTVLAFCCCIRGIFGQLRMFATTTPCHAGNTVMHLHEAFSQLLRIIALMLGWLA